jgi:hypothetical protein
MQRNNRIETDSQQNYEYIPVYLNLPKFKSIILKGSASDFHYSLLEHFNITGDNSSV